ncbi:ketosteroid isomerase-like protein [Streptacidiphilus sp. MAP12-20]|uniref:nuclear transport factor 2 family protein n=1 Tax=Streptacidiphilus sp. MAP12-20 TaxID=3156299 RepID=UPI003518340D
MTILVPTSTSGAAALRHRTADILVRDLFRAVDGRAWEDLAQIFAKDAVYERPGYPPLLGLDRILYFYEHERIIAAGRHHVDHITGGLGAAACWGRFQGTSRTGEPLDEPFADTYVVREGLITHRRTYFWRPAI